MIRSIVGVLFVMLALAVPASAQIQYCVGYISCNYVENSGFGLTTGWTYTGTGSNASVRANVTDPCSLGTTWAGRVGAANTIYQEFWAEPIGSGPPQTWSVSYDVYFGSSGGGIYDQLKLEVKDLDTNAVETKIINAGQYGTCASGIVFNLSNDYTGHDVRITFTKGGLASMTIDVDNVAMWGSL